ncbi:MAG: 30S ribosomal protein S18 [Elusimicrobia bacterium]|nr:30S ribosomal protein S18 [Elusimicrobiota bacterium]
MARFMSRRRKPFPKRRCRFCKSKIEIDYKNVRLLKNFIGDNGRILTSRITGTCTKHQRRLANAIKRARHLALLPYVV